jgi:hypothetical protein
LSGAGVSGLTSLAGGGVGSGAGADAGGGGGGGGGASSFFLQPAKVKAQANTIIIDNDKNSFFILASRYTKVSQYVLRICGFYIQGALTLAPLAQLDGYKRPLVSSLSGNLQRFGMEKVGKLESLQEIIADMTETNEVNDRRSAVCPPPSSSARSDV